MNCPNCKNPIADYATICEWCGANYVNKNEKKFQNNGVDGEFLNILTENPTLLQLDQSVKLYREKTGNSVLVARKYINTLWHSHYQNESQKLVSYLQMSFWKNYGCFFWFPVIGWLSALIYLLFPSLKKIDIKNQSNIFSPAAQKYFSNYSKL